MKQSSHLRAGKRRREKELIQERINKHLQELKALGYIPNTLKPLQVLENEAHAMAEDQCNGIRDLTELEWNDIEKQVRALFSRYLNGLILNGDPRGYTLKIDDSIMRHENYKLYQDMGGYGILYPDFQW